MTDVKNSEGAITRVPGFRAAGVSCGLKDNGQLDLALIECGQETNAAAMFTTNAFKAAPVEFDIGLLSGTEPARIRAIVANSGNANACTGIQGLADTRRMAGLVEESLHLPAGSVLVLSTGIIGKHMPMTKIEAGIHSASQVLSTAGGKNAARAILTTDKVIKEAFARCVIGEVPVSVGGIAKGSGMIHPDLASAHKSASSPTCALHATMLSVIVTDANVSPELLQAALEQAVKVSFNRVSVDGDTSTNDTVLLLASGQAGNQVIDLGSDSYDTFLATLTDVCVSLAKQIAFDGEGATHLVEIVVKGAKSDCDAERAAKTVATSPLVKTAIFGRDPNWGRILAAIGRSGIDVAPGKTGLWLGDVQLVDNGEPLDFDANACHEALDTPEVKITADLGIGSGQAKVWTCDFSYKYVEINAEYHT
jgi:glutamate N-acetyltransferase/amino-acid N-acetyltransferase